MNGRVLFLAQEMSLGFGVAVVVHNISMQLESLGLYVEVGCLKKDDSLDGSYTVHVVQANASEIDELIIANDIDYVIAHTSPFFEVLPELTAPCKSWVWEHGDPTPELFPFDSAERKKIAERKRYMVYPRVDVVVAISDFIRSDIKWPAAKVIYNGCDHVHPVPSKRQQDGLLRVGTLMRLGAGEAFYKGNRLFVDLVRSLSREGDSIDFHLMGRGSLEDALVFEEAGVTVHLNATDEERAQYLADLDVFVSLSLWEGFNLPLLEAAISGTVPFALDTGAHPEVTPYVFSNVSEMSALIGTLAIENEDYLRAISRRVQDYAKCRFSWEKSAKAMVALLQ
jgi:glycosyltransferase involved in cell wall biosynthesis